MHLIAGLRKAESGQAFVGETDIQALHPTDADRFRRRHVGLIFQFFNLIPSLTLEMNIALPLLLDGRKLPDLRPRINDLVDLLEISHRRNHAPHELSGGEMQRVAIARALIINPALILADEPTGNLDTTSGQDVMGLFEGLSAEGRTIVLITHDPALARRCRRIVRIQDGRIVEDRPSAEAA